jgi:hypothetical protein
MLRKSRLGKRPILNLKTQTLIPSEYQECKTFWQYATRLGFAEDLIKHANERKERDGGWFLKALFAIGFRKGLLDYQYIVANQKYHSLWIEMKRLDHDPKNNKAEQDEWIERLLKKGHYASYAYGCDHAIKIYQDYINNRL